MQREQRLRLFAELWVSFVALIRSYVAAHDLAEPVANHVRVDESKAGRLALRGQGKALDLKFDPDTGAGSWMVYGTGSGDALEQGSFEVDENAQVALSDRAGKLELEVAAEAFTARIFD